MSESTKDKIIRIGFNLMQEKGYDNVTINEICKEVQISKHTFYYYFNSKEDILHDFVRIPRELKQDIMAELITMDSALDQYIAVITPKIQYMEKCGFEIVKKILLANLTIGLRKDRENCSHPIMDLEINLIQKAQEKKEITNAAPADELVYLCFTTMVGLCQMWATTEGHFSLQEHYIQMVKNILGPVQK